MVAPVLLSKPKSLSRTEAKALLPLARAGDEAAAQRMIAGVSAFIARTAKKYARRFPSADLDDLVQAGLIAASQSITTYDPDRGTAAWTSYAMTASARGIAREAAKSKQLLDRFPTPDTGGMLDDETLAEREQTWDASEIGPVAAVRWALDQLDPIDRGLIEYGHGITGERLEGAELAAKLGLRSRKIVHLMARAHARLRAVLGKALGKE